MGFLTGLKTKKLRKSIQKEPNNFQNYRELLPLLEQDERFDEMIDVLAGAKVLTWKEEERIWFLLQELRVKKHQARNEEILPTALEILKSENAGADSKLDAAMLAAEITLGEGGIELSEEMLQLVKKHLYDDEIIKPGSSDSIRPRLLAAEIETSLGHFSSAMEKMDAAVLQAERIRYSETGSLYLKAARIARMASAGDSKIQMYLKKALDTGDLSDLQTVELLSEMSSLLMDSDDLLGAMDKLETALRFCASKRDANSASIRFRLAGIYKELGRIPQALAEANLALQCSDLDGDLISRIHQWKAKLFSDQEKWEEAQKEAEQSMASASSEKVRAQALQLAAEIYHAGEDHQKALVLWLQLGELADFAENSEVRFKTAKAYTLAGEPYRALKILNSLEDAAGAEKAFHIKFEIAMAVLAQRKIVKALEALLQIIEDAPESEEIYEIAKKRIITLKKELSTPEGRQNYKIDSSDRKYLASLLDRSPDEDDFFTRLKKGLMKTKAGFIGGLEKILSGKTDIDDEVIDEIEELMILSDLGVDTTRRIMDGLREKLRKKELANPELVKLHIRTEIESILGKSGEKLEVNSSAKPYVIMMVGVNGVGKTTTIAKIANRLKEEGKTVLLAAGDTFRAGAIEQLQEWGRRLDLEVVSQTEGSDPSAVAWDAISVAKNRGVDVLIVDTAGRLHTKSNLMEELKKVHRVLGKNMEGAPNEVLLVLDATTGQNAITQAKIFNEAVAVDGIVLTKLDGTAKGGIIVGIVDSLKIPVKLIGIGERMDDLRQFEPAVFTAALFED